MGYTPWVISFHDGLRVKTSSLPFASLFNGKYPSAYMPLEKASEELKA
nr:MAG TPA: hypothetical protein [Crassvirales sp.]